MQSVSNLKKGKLQAGNGEEPVKLPIAHLGDMARTGSHGNEADRLFNPLDAGTGRRPSPWSGGHDCAAQRTIESPATDRLYVRPGLENRAGRLVGTISRLHLNDNFRYNSQSTAALMPPYPASEAAVGSTSGGGQQAGESIGLVAEHQLGGR